MISCLKFNQLHEKKKSTFCLHSTDEASQGLIAEDDELIHHGHHTIPEGHHLGTI